MEGAIGTKQKLHPDFAEWMMGYPRGWTDVRPLETPSCPNVVSGLVSK